MSCSLEGKYGVLKSYLKLHWTGIFIWGILTTMISLTDFAMKNKGCGFDPESFLSVIDGLGKRGNKQEVDELSEIMMEMETKGRVADKVYRIEREMIGRKPNNTCGSDWQTIVHRDDGSGIALKTLKQVQKGWGRESLTSLQPQTNEFIDYCEEMIRQFLSVGWRDNGTPKQSQERYQPLGSQEFLPDVHQVN